MKLTSVFAAAGQLEAEMIKAFLEAQEIDVVLNQESVGKTLGLSAGYLGQVYIMVAEEQAELARSYLQDMLEGKYEEEDEVVYPAEQSESEDTEGE